MVAPSTHVWKSVPVRGVEVRTRRGNEVMLSREREQSLRILSGVGSVEHLDTVETELDQFGQRRLERLGCLAGVPHRVSPDRETARRVDELDASRHGGAVSIYPSRSAVGEVVVQELGKARESLTFTTRTVSLVLEHDLREQRPTDGAMLVEGAIEIHEPTVFTQLVRHLFDAVLPRALLAYELGLELRAFEIDVIPEQVEALAAVNDRQLDARNHADAERLADLGSRRDVIHSVVVHNRDRLQVVLSASLQKLLNREEPVREIRVHVKIELHSVSSWVWGD